MSYREIAENAIHRLKRLVPDVSFTTVSNNMRQTSAYFYAKKTEDEDEALKIRVSNHDPVYNFDLSFQIPTGSDPDEATDFLVEKLAPILKKWNGNKNDPFLKKLLTRSIQLGKHYELKEPETITLDLRRTKDPKSDRAEEVIRKDRLDVDWDRLGKDRERWRVVRMTNDLGLAYDTGLRGNMIGLHDWQLLEVAERLFKPMTIRTSSLNVARRWLRYLADRKN
jgi:hypothetical protein